MQPTLSKPAQRIELPEKQPANNAATEKRTKEEARHSAAADAAKAERQTQQLKGLTETIGKAIRNAFQPKPKLIRRVVPLPAPLPMVNGFQPNVKPQPGEVEQHLGRLQAYSRTSQDWVASICGLSDEQTEKLAKTCRQNVELSQRDWLQKPRSARGSLYFSDTFPIKFTLPSGAADEVDWVRFLKPIDSLRSLLTSEQTETLSVALAERRQFQLDCMIDQIINIMDGELFLTLEQREHFRTTLPSRVEDLRGESLSLFPQTYFYKQSSIATLMQKGAHLNVLTDIQERRAQDFSATGGNSTQFVNRQHIRFSSNESAEQWHDRLKQDASNQRDRVHLACAVRADYHRAVDNLSESQTKHLLVAARGVTEDIVRAWRKQTQKTLKTYDEHLAVRGRFGGTFSFSVRSVDLALIDRNPIWQHTLAKFSNGADRIRGDSRRRADTATIVGFLDRELWLRQDQRSQLTKLVYDCVPEHGVTPSQTVSSYADVALTLLPLSRISQQDVATLTPPQQDVWKKLKAHFHFTERTAQVLNLPNGRSMSIAIPR